MAKTITLPDKPKAINLPRVTRELVQCQMCGYCIDVCEAHRQTPWESVTARGKIYYLNQLDKAGFGLMDKVLGRKVTISPEFVDAIYKCTGCGNCEEICHAKIELVKLWENVRTWLVQQGVAPLPVHKGIAQKIAKTGNSFGEPKSKRDAWWPKEVERAEAPDVLMFAGCTGSYRMQHIPAAGATILARAGVRINCMGEDEVCCTSPLLRTGIRDLTLDISRQIVTKADAMGAKDMVMTCAGCYKTISSNIGNYYSKTGQNVYHFTQYVDKLIKERKLPMNNEFKAKVTYHDPCHLGRHSKVYEEPRNILKKIKGIEFVEMERNRENSRCCGAGGGYKSAFNDFAVNIAMERIHDAEAVGAEVIATACPFCVLNLKAGAKKAGSSIKVMDISEILLQVTAPKVEEPAVEEVPAAPAAGDTVSSEALKAAEEALAAAEAAKAAAEAAAAEAKAEAEKAQAEKAAAEEALKAAEDKMKAAESAERMADAYEYAEKANKANVESGKYDEKRAEAFSSQIEEVKASEASDDEKATALAQVIGGMILAAMAGANAEKPEEAAAEEEAPAEEAEAEGAADESAAVAEAASASEADPYTYARDKNKANVESGKYDEKRAAMYESQIAEVEAAEADDATKKIMMSQVIGGMMLGAMAAAGATKEEEAPAEEAEAGGAAESAEEAPAEETSSMEADPYTYARDKNKANVESGKYDEKRAAMYESQIAEVEAAEADDATKKIMMSQVIGGMMLGAMAATGATKEEEAPAEEPAVEEIEGFEEGGDEGFDDFDEWALTPEGIVRRAAWNKGLRCRREYGPLEIPIAFVKPKVAVYVGQDAEVNRAKLEKDGWIVLHYEEADVTDGQAQAEEIKDAAKSQLRAQKKKKKKKK